MWTRVSSRLFSAISPRLARQPAPLHGAAGDVTYNHVVVRRLSGEEVDRLFQALADGTRRDILHRCIGGEPSVSRLADVYPMSFAAVQKHVAVLERAGLVSKQRIGRRKVVMTNPYGLLVARQLLDQYEALWRDRIDRMTDLVNETKEIQQ